MYYCIFASSCLSVSSSVCKHLPFLTYPYNCRFLTEWNEKNHVLKIGDSTYCFSNNLNKTLFTHWGDWKFWQSEKSMVTSKLWIRPTSSPSFFKACLALDNAFQGTGKSKNTASATWSRPKPFWHTSRCLTVTNCDMPCSSNSSAAFSARCSWNSNVWRWPVGAIVLIIACDREALPVPESN